TIINAAAYTNVDGAETTEGRIDAWQVNASAVGNLLPLGWRNKITIVHISTDYVFDGSQNPHTETEAFSPLSVYGASKAAGDLLVAQVEKHYILRTSWVIGEGKNFVRTMLELGKKGVNPTVVSDQVGRLTFTSELVRGIDYLLSHNSPFGTYNLTNDGGAASWADIASKIYELAGLPATVTEISTEAYYKDKPQTASRPLNSGLDLSKIKSVGFQPKNWEDDLKDYVKKELNEKS
ncbi:MAG: SDR family oxidoreductase, partial [Candidatus Saccharimonadales bacterium]